MNKNDKEKRNQKIISMYIDGEKAPFLASIFGLTEAQIYSILKKSKAVEKSRLDKKI